MSMLKLSLLMIIKMAQNKKGPTTVISYKRTCKFVGVPIQLWYLNLFIHFIIENSTLYCTYMKHWNTNR